MNCKWKSKNNKFCNRNVKSGYTCIFHKNNKTKRENILFKHYIKKEKITYFLGFCFEEDFNIKEILNYKYNYLIFEECIFYKKADFSNFIFKGKIKFLNCKFLDEVWFFDSNIDANFIMEGNYFEEKIINNKIFRNTNINCQSFKLTGNTNLPRLDGIAFSKETKFILRDCHYTKNYNYIGKVNYTIAEIQAEKIHDDKNIGYYTYYERKYNTINRNDFGNYGEYLISKVLNYIARELMGYGEHLSKFFIYIISIISIFAFLYMLIGVTTASGEIIKFDFKNTNSIFGFLKMYIEFWYFSVITFSTVGFGDMTINGIIGKILVCLEVFIGITIQSTWAALIIKRMFR
ncbi:MAG: potassium channel family protein [Intestinibacter bartlettii]|uniref:potassium channel family protein n=1 Tax=Intestinibacter bartlettii TaxID=261299 RepID=UPI0026EE87D3|nr:potassium channel family protein [Intestinibacter bartlettii]MDO5010168.1 potassium channel family protein [Intestinibacter bartlettii]